jgi:hypothetical protein
MPESVSLLLIQFLEWISSRRRTYAETMDAWRSSCPRLTVWEDALVGELIQIENDGEQQAEVKLTARGRAILDGQRT